MGIGYLVLYVALAMVALWLLAELLLQNRAPLHWRALALAGFLAVVAGMGLSAVVVIGAGAAAFALGQVFVTLSVKRGRAVAWSLRRSDGRLPGPLARIPLLSAATGGAAAAAAAVVVQPVGEVGPVEPAEPLSATETGVPADAPFAAYAPHQTHQSYEPYEPYQSYEPYGQLQEIGNDGVYTDAPAAFAQQPDQYPQNDGFQFQPAAAGAYPGQYWPQQPAFGYDQSYPAAAPYQDPYGQPQPQYDQLHEQYQYDQSGYAAQSWEQQPAVVPEQTVYGQHPGPWGYQQG
ncbi:hypothetical protein [Kitasatospora sp. GP82]|uniref:hypothetical protein n=1 Tax=Kitasatospora sp. GP82 TaxID=3035089 RepID=UPI002474B4D7|nr:hypothetical protein [Kitasatospora sp. GP82]MDH6127226.1 opacity protein-like surface antigen [Kitasatospora sp. GP82]